MPTTPSTPHATRSCGLRVRALPRVDMARWQLLATGCASAHGHRAARQHEVHGSAGVTAAGMTREPPHGLQEVHQKLDMLEYKPAWPCSAARDSVLLCSLSRLSMLKLSSICFEIF